MKPDAINQPSIGADAATAVRDLLDQMLRAMHNRAYSPRIRLLDISQVCEATGLGERTIWRMISEGKFPKPQDGLGGDVRKTVRWRESTLIAWVERNDPNHDLKGGQ